MLLAFDETTTRRDARTFKQTVRVIVPLTVRDILDEQIAHKLA